MEACRRYGVGRRRRAERRARALSEAAEARVRRRPAEERASSAGTPHLPQHPLLLIPLVQPAHRLRSIACVGVWGLGLGIGGRGCPGAPRPRRMWTLDECRQELSCGKAAATRRFGVLALGWRAGTRHTGWASWSAFQRLGCMSCTARGAADTVRVARTCTMLLKLSVRPCRSLNASSITACAPHRSTARHGTAQR